MLYLIFAPVIIAFLFLKHVHVAPSVAPLRAVLLWNCLCPVIQMEILHGDDCFSLEYFESDEQQGQGLQKVF